jgi:GPH family glycoside/pentoside/hexuronide:cation symporter
MAGIYAKFFNLQFQEIGWIFFVVSLLTAIATPAIGILSDRHRELVGTRKPWVIVALCTVTIAGYQLMRPPSHVSLAYFAWWVLLLSLSQTAYDIAHLAWGSELATNYNDSTKLVAVRTLISAFGAIAFFAMPLLPFFRSKDITPDVLHCCAILAVIFMIPAVYCTARSIPRGDSRASSVDQNITCTVREILSNKPFLALIRITMLLSISEGMWLSLA